MGNIHQHLDLIAGLPNEDYKSFGKSFDAVFALRPEQLQLGFLKVLKGSYMYENREAYGLVYRSEPPYEVLSTNWVTYDEMIRLKGIEQIVELYYNSHQYDKTLESVFEGETSAFGFFESLADDYRAKGHHMVNHSRKEKYYILNDKFVPCPMMIGVDNWTVEKIYQETDLSLLASFSMMIFLKQKPKEAMRNLEGWKKRK